MHLASLARPFNEAAVPEAGEVPQHVGLGQPSVGDEIRHAARAIHQRLDQRKAGAIGKAVEEHGTSFGLHTNNA